MALWKNKIGKKHLRYNGGYRNCMRQVQTCQVFTVIKLYETGTDMSGIHCNKIVCKKV
jgi:hypothetical protein